MHEKICKNCRFPKEAWEHTYKPHSGYSEIYSTYTIKEAGGKILASPKRLYIECSRMPAKYDDDFFTFLEGGVSEYSATLDSTLTYTADGSSYWSGLMVSANFGCVLFEPKPSSEESEPENKRLR